MRLLRQSKFAMLLGVVVLMSILTMAGCGGGGSGSGVGSGVTVKVGSKKDADGRLLGEMYALLLEKAGYTVQRNLGAGDTPFMQNAIANGTIDLYPEFTGTAMSSYKLPATKDAQAAYNEVKDYYSKNLKLTWLDAAFNLNDSYAICTSQANATKYNLKSNADGSVTLYFQNESPGKDKEANWLPAPKGEFIPMLRMYWPKDKPPSIIDGSWKPPAVQPAP